MRLGRRVDGVRPAQRPTLEDRDQHERRDDGGHRGQGGGADVVAVAGAEVLEAVHGQEVGQVRHGKQQRPGVGDPERGEREGHRRDAGLLRDREADRGEQHGRRVEAHHDRADDGEGREEQPEQHDPVPRPAGHRVCGDVEDAGQLGDLGRHGDRQQEHRDRQDLGDDRVEDLGHAGHHGKAWCRVRERCRSPVRAGGRTPGCRSTRRRSPARSGAARGRTARRRRPGRR